MKRMFLTVVLTLGLMVGVAFAQMGGMMSEQGMMEQSTHEQPATQQMPYQMMPAGYGLGMMGAGYTMGPAMMGGCGMGAGSMMGPGMMMGGYGMMAPGMMGYGPGFGYGMMGRGMGPAMMMGPGMMGMMHRMMGGGMMMGPGMMGPGMMWPGYGMGAGYFKKYQKFLDETRDLRKQLNEKRFEYFEALRNPKTEFETLSKLRKEIFDLKEKIYQKLPFKGFGCH